MTKETYTPCYCCGNCDVLTPYDYPFLKATCGYCTRTHTVIFPYDLLDTSNDCPHAWQLNEPDKQYESWLFPDYTAELAKITAVTV